MCDSCSPGELLAGFEERASRLNEHERVTQASDLMERFAGAVGLHDSTDDEAGSEEDSSSSSLAVAPGDSSAL